jgi:LmbE family N-acetylglucosaminyl deacetylase
MAKELRLAGVFAHPDDESMGVGGTFARYAAEGVGTFLLTATRGQKGWFGPEAEYPGPEVLGRVRETELREAARVLRIDDLTLLDHVDGELDAVDPAIVTAEIVDFLRRARPQVVITFDPAGAYGHPDHVAVSQLTMAAAVAAIDPAYEGAAGLPPHRVEKLYYIANPRESWDDYESAFGELVMRIDGSERRTHAWEHWEITTWIDTSDCWRRVWEAIACHRSQLPGYRSLLALPEETHRRLWGRQPFYRAYSLVNGGRQPETDLFEGVRAPSQALPSRHERP